MKRMMTLLFLSHLPLLLPAQQDISGLWYSEDTTRVYEFRSLSPDQFEARIKSTSRPGEKAGVTILKQVRKSRSGDSYKGIIFSPDSSGIQAKAKLRLKTNGRILQLRISRLILLPVKIRWYRSTPE